MKNVIIIGLSIVTVMLACLLVQSQRRYSELAESSKMLTNVSCRSNFEYEFEFLVGDMEECVNETNLSVYEFWLKLKDKTDNVDSWEEFIDLIKGDKGEPAKDVKK